MNIGTANILRRFAQRAQKTLFSKSVFIGLTLLSVGAGLTGCRRSEFTLEVNLPTEIWGNYHISYYASDGKGGVWVSTTIPLEQGHLSLKGASRQGSPIYLRDDSQNEAIFFITPGDHLKLTGDEANPLHWNAEGNEISSQLAEFRKSGESIEKFIEGNPDSPASPLLLLTRFPRHDEPEKFASLWNSLSDGAERVMMAELVGSPDIGANSVFTLTGEGEIRIRGGKAVIRSLAFYGRDGWSDTLRTADRPSIIYFYDQTGDDHYFESIDTIDRLIKDFPDSTRRNIALLSLQSDSLSWKYQVRQDSLKRVTRGWVPLGVADRRMQAIGLPSAPWFIVTDGKGTQKYRGADLRQASRVFRSVVKDAKAKDAKAKDVNK